MNTRGQAVPPSFAILVAIVVLCSFDALCGFLAALVFTGGVLASGHVGSADAFRTLLGIDVVMFAAALAGSAARPLRRVPAKTLAQWYDRLADFAIAALIAMWALDKMFGALPAISGLSFPVAARANELAVILGVAVLARYLLETVSAHLYPQRLAAVARDKIGFPKPIQQICSGVLKTAIFVFFAVAYLGDIWEVWVGAVLAFVPGVIAAYQYELPNFPKIVKFLPAGIVKVVMMLAAGKLFATLIHHEIPSPARFIALGFVILGLPSLALGSLGLIAREGDTFPLTWLWRIVGIGLVGVGICLVEGVITV